jgi:integrase/recombinase XerD
VAGILFSGSDPEKRRSVMDVVSRVRVAGPLAEYAAGFAAELDGAGYTPESAAGQVRVLAHLSRWLGERGLVPGALTAERVAEFAAARRAAGCRQWVSVRGMGPLLGYLRGLGLVLICPELSGQRICG